jgi:predicted flap endonuclease-1-like 5' DNA nuclease
MFKTKGFSSNNSLKRRGIIVDAPDLPPEECEFYITSTGIADTEKSEITTIEEPILDFEVETLYEESDPGGVEESEVSINTNDNSTSVPITNVKGIGKGTAENLKNQGISSINDLISADPEELASKISGISSKKVIEMQKSAEILIQT